MLDSARALAVLGIYEPGAIDSILSSDDPAYVLLTIGKDPPQRILDRLAVLGSIRAVQREPYYLLTTLPKRAPETNPPDKLLYDFLRKTNGTVTSQLQFGGAGRDTLLQMSSSFFTDCQLGGLIWAYKWTREVPWMLPPMERPRWRRRGGALSLVGSYVRGWRWDCVWQGVVRQHRPLCATAGVRLAVSYQDANKDPRGRNQH